MKVKKMLFYMTIFSSCSVKVAHVTAQKVDLSRIKFEDVTIDPTFLENLPVYLDHDWSPPTSKIFRPVNFINKSSKKITLQGDITLDVGESKRIDLRYALLGQGHTSYAHFTWSQEIDGRIRKHSGSVGMPPIDERSFATIAIKDDGKYENKYEKF